MYYEGGTYISQVKAIEIKDALLLWTKELDISLVENLSNEDKKIAKFGYTRDILSN